MKKLIVLTFVALFGFPTSSCEEACKVLYFADMICSKLAVAVPSVQTGTAFAITTIIKNVAESADLCETEPAPASDTKYNVKFRANEDQPWKAQEVTVNGSPTFDAFVPTSKLDPDQDTGLEPTFKMNTPGQYRFEGFADGKTAVDERDESNNGGGNADGSLTGKSASQGQYVIVTVVAGPDYVPIKGAQPKVEYLGFKKLW